MTDFFRNPSAPATDELRSHFYPLGQRHEEKDDCCLNHKA